MALPIPLAAIVEQSGVLAPDTLFEALNWAEAHDRARAAAAIAQEMA